MSENRLILLVGGIAGLLTVCSIGWWWLVFGKITAAGTISPLEAVTCLAADTDLCRLAEALCTNDHFINIRWYAPEMFWAAAATAAVAAYQRHRRAPTA